MQIQHENFPVYQRALESKRPGKASSLSACFADAVAGDDVSKFHFVMHMQHLAQGMLTRNYHVTLDKDGRQETLKACFDFYNDFVKAERAPTDSFMAHVLLAGMYKKGEGCETDPVRATQHRDIAFRGMK